MARITLGELEAPALCKFTNDNKSSILFKISKDEVIVMVNKHCWRNNTKYKIYNWDLPSTKRNLTDDSHIPIVSSHLKVELLYDLFDSEQT